MHEIFPVLSSNLHKYHTTSIIFYQKLKFYPIFEPWVRTYCITFFLVQNILCLLSCICDIICVYSQARPSGSTLEDSGEEREHDAREECDEESGDESRQEREERKKEKRQEKTEKKKE